jgi:hypothetical protein
VNTHAAADSRPRPHHSAKESARLQAGQDADAAVGHRGWWRAEGRRLYPTTKTLLITADGGRSNGYRLRQWKLELQRFADGAGLSVMVCHFPPGPRK